jgi:integrase
VYCRAEKDLGTLRALLKQTDLAALVEPFLEAAHCSADTKAHYKALIRRLIPEGVEFPAEQFTAHRLQKTIDEMAASPATKRKAGAAFRTFGNWLVRRGYLRDNPMRQVSLPKGGSPRAKFLETADAITLADAQPSPYREYAALLAGSGIEVSTALALRVRDVDVKHREIRAAGTKTHSRDRVVRVADWAWPYVQRAMKRKQKDDLLFEGIPDRWYANDAHRAAVKALTHDSAGKPIAGSPFIGYTMRDHRHTYAVRQVRAGAPPEVIAHQLGHANPTLLLTVYGRFKPSQLERNRWEQAAAKFDRAPKRPSRARKPKPETTQP